MFVTLFGCLGKAAAEKIANQIEGAFVRVRTRWGQPSLCWTYMDEDIGGNVGHVPESLGFMITAAGFSVSLIAHTRMQPLVRLV